MILLLFYQDIIFTGIIGIVASRLKEKFNKPTIIISVLNKIGKASARSVNGFDIGT